MKPNMSSNLYILYPYDTKGKTGAMCTIMWNEPTPLKYVVCEAEKYFKKKSKSVFEWCARPPP